MALGGLTVTFASFLTAMLRALQPSAQSRASRSAFTGGPALQTIPRWPQDVPLHRGVVMFGCAVQSPLLGKELLPVSCLNETNRAQGHSCWAAALQACCVWCGPGATTLEHGWGHSHDSPLGCLLVAAALNPMCIHLCSLGLGCFLECSKDTGCCC